MSSTQTAAPRARRRASPAALVVVASPDASAIGRRLDLRGPPTTLGRTERASVRIQDGRMSGLHAALRPSRSAGPCTVADLDSRNGLFVDGQAAPSASLHPGTVVRVGDTCLVVDDGPGHDDPMLRGISGGVNRLRADLDKVAPTSLRVLLLGETGTGKELAAQRVHTASGRRGPLVPVNCAAIVAELAESTLFGHRRGAFTGAADNQPGLFVQADGGTLLLDEVGDLPLPLQAKLLRVLEDGHITPVGGRTARAVDVRVVAATNVDLHAAVEQGRFRADLLARLEEWPVTLPPLRDRRTDIPLLAAAFLGRPVEGDVAEALLLHAWPFNVRGLRQLCRRLRVARPEGPELEDLPQALSGRIMDRHPQLDPREQLIDALKQAGGNASQAARILGVSRRTIYRRMDELDIDPDQHRS